VALERLTEGEAGEDWPPRLAFLPVVGSTACSDGMSRAVKLN
jgi:hypothetical protein